MEVLIILYLVFAHQFSPQGERCHYPLQLERTNKHAVVWERPVQTYERKRIHVDEAEKELLRDRFRNIEYAYSNNSIEAMERAIACVSNRVDNIEDELYIKLSNGLVGLYSERFLNKGQLHQFSSPSEFEHFAQLHLEMALFLGESHYRRNEYYGQSPWLEYQTLEVLGKYLHCFSNEGRTDCATVARRLFDEWTTHIESNQGFVRRFAYHDVDITRPMIKLGKLTPEMVRLGVFVRVCDLIKCGYTPKWLDEFYDADGLKLRELYDAIVKAYVNNQEEAMLRAMTRVQNHWGAKSRLYFDCDYLLELLYSESFLNEGSPRPFNSLAEFEQFLSLNTRMAYFLCGCEYKMGESHSDFTRGKLECKTYLALKKYADKFRTEGKKDFAAAAQKHLNAWVAYLESEHAFVYRLTYYYRDHGKNARDGVRTAVSELIKNGYTPKWLDEFEDFK